MIQVNKLQVLSGIQAGFWNPIDRPNPFTPKAMYVGEDLGDKLPGQRIKVSLEEGDVYLRVGVLFTPRLVKKLSTILIFENFMEEIYGYIQQYRGAQY